MKKNRDVRSRRAVLTGLGALTGSALVGSRVKAAGTVGPTSDPGASAWAAPQEDERAAPSTFGTRYINIAGIDLKAGSNTATFTSVSGELTSTSSAFFTYPLVSIPGGARLTEFVAYFIKNAANDIQMRIVRSDGSPGGNIFATFFNTDTSSFAVSGTPQTHIVAVPNVANAVIDPANTAHFVIVNMPGVAGVSLRGIRIGYVPSLSNFVPLAPGRVFDSRLALFGAAPIVNGQNMFVNVSHRRNLDGSLAALDYVPAGALAISFNITVTETVGGGFLAVTPGNAIEFSAASINWSASGQTLNTGTNSQLDPNRLVRVWCGGTVGAQTHFIIDVNGYYI